MKATQIAGDATRAARAGVLIVRKAMPAVTSKPTAIHTYTH